MTAIEKLNIEILKADIAIKKQPFTKKGQKLLKAIEHEINCLSLENESHTPDFVLAEFMLDCLTALNTAIRARDKYYCVRANGIDLQQGLQGRGK